MRRTQTWSNDVAQLFVSTQGKLNWFSSSVSTVIHCPGRGEDLEGDVETLEAETAHTELQ